MLSVLVLLCTLLLVGIAVIFYSDSSAPGFLGYNIYLVRTDAFSLINNGTALISKESPFEDIKPGNIIIFSSEDGKKEIGEIRDIEFSDGVYSFRTRLSDNSEITLGQSKIIGKGLYISDTIGSLISFAVSPAGVAVIAVLPCTMIIIFEIVNSIRARREREEDAPAEEFSNSPRVVGKPRTAREPRPLIEESTLSDIHSVIPAPKREFTPEETGLFQPPKAGQPTKAKQSIPQSKKPISGRDLEKIIRETKAEHEKTPSAIRQPAAESQPRSGLSAREAVLGRDAAPPEREVQHQRPAFTAAARAAYGEVSTPVPQPVQRPQPDSGEKGGAARRPKQPMTATQQTRSTKQPQYEPVQPAYEDAKLYTPSLSRTEQSVSPLDRLLQEDQTGDIHYDIDDILKSLENK